MEIPSYDQLMWPTLQALKALGGSGTNQEILAKVIEVANITDDMLAVVHKDGRSSLVAYRAAWAKTYLKKGGAVENSARGVWTITDKGEALVEAEMIPFLRSVQQIIKESAEPKGQQSSGDNDEAEDLSESWRSTLLAALLSMAPDAFERLAQLLLRESGFQTVMVSGRSGDGGIDGTGILQVKLITFPVSFQCKRYKGSVGTNLIRDFRGAIMGRSEKGLLITTGTFTADAVREASRDGALTIDLVDGDRLCTLLKELGLGVQTEMVEKVTVKPEWFAQI